MRLSFFHLLLLAPLVTPIAAKADTITLGPLTFGSNIIIPGFDGFYSMYNLVNLGALPTSVDSTTETIAFTFDIASGWEITGMTAVGANDYDFDGENSIPPAPFSSWGYEYAQEMTLCSADDVCSSASETLEAGGALLPPVSFNAQAGPGTGVYQSFLYSDNVDVELGYDLPQIDIYLTQESPVPEPSTLVLMGTGALGLIRAVVRKMQPGSSQV
jgi:PEP-CTERM motif